MLINNLHMPDDSAAPPSIHPGLSPHLDLLPQRVLAYAHAQLGLELICPSRRDLHGTHKHLRRERQPPGVMHGRELALGRERKGERPMREALLEPGRVQ